MLGLSLSLDIAPLGGSAYDPAAVALFAAMTTPPTDARKALINALIVSLKAAGIWTLLDVLYLIAAADSQAARLNCINPATFTLSAVNSPAFTADRGYAGDGLSAYVDTTLNPVTAPSPKIAQNDNSQWVWMRSVGAAASTYFGNNNSSVMRSATVSQIRNSTLTTVTGTTTIANQAGVVFGAIRTGGASVDVYRAGAFVETLTSASTGLSSNSMSLLARSGSASFNSGQIAFAALGGSLTASQAATLQSCVAAYMTGVGA